MAAKVLDDILNNFLPIDCLLDWLSNNSSRKQDDIFINQYECSQVEFVSYFLNFLREKSSRNFQIYDVETSRENSHLRTIKPATGKSSPGTQQSTTATTPRLDLESLQSFPSLSSCSSKTDCFERRLLDSTPNENKQDPSNRETSERKFRRVKLFSETVEGSNKTNKVDILDEGIDRVAVSTPKPTNHNSLPVTDFFNHSDLQDISPKLGSKPKWKNHSFDLASPDVASMAPKSRSFGSDSFRRDNKTNCRMSLGDFFLNDVNSDNKKEKKNKARKRINPVRVSNHSQGSVNSSFSEKTEDSADGRYSVADDIQLKLDGITLADETENVDKNPKAIKSNLNAPAEHQPEPNLATNITELKILSQIYSFLINENYCQNITIELCFVISLLIVQEYKKKSLEQDLQNLSLNGDKDLFESIHNCVFFAVETLWLQRNVLFLLNLSALKLLSENVRVEKFNEKLKDFLVSAYSQRQLSEEIKRRNGMIKAGMQGNVSFQYETDNRENFTSVASFQSFRKQRDLFYNILAIWEANHLASGWIFSVGLSSKIRSLLSISSDPINLLHLARLFRNQLVMSCYGENQTEEEFNEEILQLLPSADPNKIQRLRARLTSSPKRQGPCPLPDFTGHQEFYKDFILCTSHSTFNEHLKNSLCDEILRLNDIELTGDIEDEESSLDEQTQERYLHTINILRLLAKFLGFVEFLPYRGEKPLSDKIVNIHCSVRFNTLPLFDAAAYLLLALKKQKLTLTIPWMVSYLSMIDSYSAHLKTYQNIWRILVMIYKHLKTLKSTKTTFYLRLTLGWIFHLPNFPSDQFYSVIDECIKNPTEALKVIGDESKPGLDSHDFIEETVLYAVCPYLNEINVILSENVGYSARHIRPVTTQENVFSKSLASKQLELRLESNFLHNQSSSTRKTVEFVTERVASIAIKHLVHNVIPKITEASWAELDDTKNAEKPEVLAESCYKKLLNVCEKENWEISCARAEIALKALLSNELQGAVADTCAKIVARQATEKVQRWMQSHVTLATVKKEFAFLPRKKSAEKTSDVNNSTLDTSEVFLNKNKDSHHLSASGRGIVHREDAWPASRALKAMQELIWKICVGGAAAKEVEEVIEEATKTVKHRNDMIPAAEKTLFALLVDLIVLYCVHSKEETLRKVFRKFFELIKCLEQQCLSNSNLERIVCPRNIVIVCKEARNKEKAFENLGNLLMSLLEEDLLTREQVEAQLLSLLRQNWEKKEGLQFARFISGILERYSKTNGYDKFSLLLEYMVDILKNEELRYENFE